MKTDIDLLIDEGSPIIPWELEALQAELDKLRV
jgi:hypothetical protein